MAYKTFIRTWYVYKNGKIVNGPGEKRFTGDIYKTESEARKACNEYNYKRKPGELSEKMEFTSDY